MDDRSAARWKRSRRRGRTFFVLVNGVLGWGVATGTLFNLTMWGILTTLGAELDAVFLVILIGSQLAFCFGGYYWGKTVWNMLDRKYSEFQRSRDVTA